MLRANPDHKLALIKSSQGRTSLRVDWKPGAQEDKESQGPRYRDFIETIWMATEQLSERHDRYVDGSKELYDHDNDSNE